MFIALTWKRFSWKVLLQNIAWEGSKLIIFSIPYNINSNILNITVFEIHSIHYNLNSDYSRSVFYLYVYIW